MPAPTLLALALFAPAQDWIALELPRLCVERPSGAWIPALDDGRHILLEEVDARRRSDASAELSATQLAQVLEAEARRRGRTLAVYAATPPLLVQGSEEDAAWARAFVESLDRGAARLSIALEASLVANGGPPARGDEVEAPDAARGGAWRAAVPSGDEVVFGEREHRRFVGNFDVEVAHNSGVAAPVIGSVFVGPTVHLRAARIAEGKRVHVVGTLDLAELLRMDEFEPDSVDLGVVEEPVVACVQVAFSGVVENGAELVVEVRGAPLSTPDWTLRVRASTAPDAPEIDDASWRIADLAFLSTVPRSLGEFSLGTGLDPLAGLERLAGSAAAATPSALHLRAESQRRSGARAAGIGNGIATERLVLLAPDEVESWRELASLARAMESTRATTASVRLESGALAVTLPVACGEAARVLVGIERTWLVDYETQIAPDTWMPAPRVERAFDGIAWQGRFDGAALECTAAESRTRSTAIVPKRAANMGGLQLPSRSLRIDRSRRGLGAEPQVLLQASSGAPALLLRFERR